MLRTRLGPLAAPVALVAWLGMASHATGKLATPDFRAVPVAHADYPISSVAVAPDGRLFAAVQALGATVGTTPGTAEIRVYSTYAANDGAVFDEGSVWATVDGIKANNNEEGLLGIALAPDFATSRLVYVYVTTTDENVNQHVRVYRENAAGTGDLVGLPVPSLEPPTGQSTRNGGPLAFGTDGCLYVGVGDNGGGDRWSAQVLQGNTAFSGTENTNLCSSVCLGSSLYPTRTGSNAELNHAGKLLRIDVDGAAAGAAPGAPLAAHPLAFGTGLRSPAGLLAHPLTGQLYVADRGDSQQAEIDVVDAASNLGWPCLEGGLVATSGVAACLVGRVPADVYAGHPEWRRPIVTHAANPVPAGLAAYTGLTYPADYYGDVFYLLRDSARIYRIDLTPPCLLPHPNGMTPIAFHDSAQDGDFTAIFDIDGDDDVDTVSFTSLSAIAQGPDPLGGRVLYVVGRQGSGNGLTDDSAIFRIEYTGTSAPWSGGVGRVDDGCFSGGVYSGGDGTSPLYAWENPFGRAACMVTTGVCAGQPDGASCAPSGGCHTGGTCQGGACVGGTPLPDGTACGDADPCNGSETCRAGSCTMTSAPAELRVRTLRLARGKPTTSGTLMLRGTIRPPAPVAPDKTDAVTLEVRDDAGALLSTTLGHPATDKWWKRRGDSYRYRKGGAGLTTVSLRAKKGGDVHVEMIGRRLTFAGPGGGMLAPRLVVGSQCFAGAAKARCTARGKGLRCR
jgi:glucose/arabinose dehydrogenase